MGSIPVRRALYYTRIMHPAYRAGAISSIKRLGLMKYAGVVTSSGEGLSVTPTQAGVVGAGVAAPFAGLVGSKKLRHDPFLGAKAPSFDTLEALSTAARPGDFVVMTKPEASIWKTFSTPTTGSDFYHAVGVVGRTPSSATQASHGLVVNPENLRDFTPEYLATQTPEALHQSMANVKRLDDVVTKQKYKDFVLLRPREAMTPEQLKSFKTDMLRRAQLPYDAPKAIGAWTKDLMVPKIPALEKIQGKDVVCKGNICSTMPAQAYTAATGKKLLPGKLTQDLLPADLLRSKELEVAGAYANPSRYKKLLGLRRALPYLSRAAIGGGVGSAIYAGTEDPAVMGAAGGALAGPIVAKKLLMRFGDSAKTLEKYPGLFEFAKEMMDTAARGKRLSMLRPLLKGSIPAALAGGALGYLGTRAIID